MFWFPITPWVTLRLAIFLPWIGRRRESLHQKAQRIALGQRRYQSTSDGFGCSTLCCKWFLFFFFGRGQKRGSGEASLCRCPWWFENEGLAGCAAIFMAFVGLRGTNHRSWNVPPKSGKVSEVSSLISGRSVYNIYIYIEVDVIWSNLLSLGRHPRHQPPTSPPVHHWRYRYRAFHGCPCCQKSISGEVFYLENFSEKDRIEGGWQIYWWSDFVFQHL